MKITINVERRTRMRSRVNVLADGKSIASGSIGGEPEDNMIDRDYAWITEAIAATATACGAEVERPRCGSLGSGR